MATGESLIQWGPFDNVAPSANYATLDLSNGHAVLDFNGTAATGETAVFQGVMPQNYADTTGVTAYIWYASDGTADDVEWEITFQRLQAGTTNITTDTWGTAQAFTADTVPGTAGIIAVHSLAVTKGANMDSVVAGDAFRIRIGRDSNNDSNNDDASLWAVELVET